MSSWDLVENSSNRIPDHCMRGGLFTYAFVLQRWIRIVDSMTVTVVYNWPITFLKVTPLFSGDNKDMSSCYPKGLKLQTRLDINLIQSTMLHNSSMHSIVFGTAVFGKCCKI